MSKRKDTPLVACVFFGSPLAFIVPGLLLPFGVPAAAGILAGLAIGALAGRAVLNRL